MDPLCEQVLSVLQAHLQPRTSRLLVAVSGGLDSMVLLHILDRLCPVLRMRLVVAHFDHRLRGRESSADAAFVRKIAEARGWRVAVGAADVRKHANEKGISIEMAAREKRYEFLAKVARSERCRVLSTAHHADDQVELFFIRLLRGAGGEGLSGMQESSGFPGQPTLALLRPLLGIPRATLAEWASSHGVRFREDGTNASMDVLRNRLRHQVLPVLAAVGGAAATQNILRSMDLIAGESDFVRQRAEEWLAGQRSPPFEKLPVALQRQVIRHQLWDAGIQPTYVLVESLRLRPGQTATAATGSRWTRTASGAVLAAPPVNESPFALNEISLRLVEQGGAVVFAGLELQWEFAQVAAPGWVRRGKPGAEVFDAAKVGESVRLRHWRPGDRFQPLGLPSPVKLQNLFVNQKIPALRRRSLVIAESLSAGQLFWVEGLRISDGFRVTAQTGRFLVWRWKRIEGGDASGGVALSDEIGSRPSPT